jgi:DNA-binding ferritin-like protein
MNKKAQDASTTEVLQNFLSILYFNTTFSQAAHWTSKGVNSYGDHLLYERLYKENNEELDSFAEQFIPLGGEQVVNPLVLLSSSADKIAKVLQFNEEPNSEDLAKAALKCELVLLANLKKLYKILKSKNTLSMGADDLLMGMYQQHESHVYLLRQRLKAD